MTHTLIFHPDYRSANPYQTLLHQHAGRELYPQAGTVAEALALQRQRSVGSRVLFHLHWEDAVYRQEPSEALAWQAAQGFLDTLETFLEAGGALVWTLHNEAPHDGRYLAVHRALAAKLARLADVVHVHALAGLAFARRELGVEPGRLALIPHGNYVDQYPRLGFPVAASRAGLGLGEARRVLLLFGRLGRYKGGPELLEAFAAVDDPGLRLVVAGRQIEPLAPALAALPAATRARIVALDRFIPPEQVPALFHAADMVVMPYRASLTSGTALLALSQARPVLAPALPGLAELLCHGEDALLYPPRATGGLEAALRRLAALNDAEIAAMRAAALAKAELYDWRHSGLLLDGVYARLLGALRPQRAPAPALRPAAAAAPIRAVDAA